MNPGWAPLVANHLWQSTLCAGVAGLLTLALRKNRARVRHWVWLAASCKFLIPFAALMALGGHMQWRTARETTPSNLSVVVDAVSQPFTAPAAASAPLLAPAAPGLSLIPAVLASVWGFGFLGISCAWWVRWRRIRAAVRAGSPIHLDISVRVISSATLVEPGVFGVFRPVLLLPDGIFDRLTPAQLKAVITHELCHMRNRDNPIAAIHMLVETVFWFHPLVWWIGKRMVDERERACDEDVLRMGCEARVYAEGILNVCKLYVESPLACVAGVTGSNIKKRIEAIMRNDIVIGLNFAKKSALVAAGAAVLAAPIAVGILDAPPMRAQSATTRPAFEVASIKRNTSSTVGESIHSQRGGRFDVQNMTVRYIIWNAYKVSDYQISGGPAWINSERYDIFAKSDGDSSPDDLLLMLRTLLEDRFGLKIHRETREGPVYVMTLAKSGLRMQHAEGTCVPRDPNNLPAQVPPGEKRPNYCGNMRRSSHTLNGQGTPVGAIAGVTPLGTLSGQLSSILDRTVIDKTGLTGLFNFGLEWTPSPVAAPPGGSAESASTDADGPSIFVALQEQLGLRLESAKGPVEMLVIDRVERPSEN